MTLILALNFITAAICITAMGLMLRQALREWLAERKPS
jgi:hypothetical protein